MVSFSCLPVKVSFNNLPVMVMVSFSCLPVKVSFNNLPVMVMVSFSCLPVMVSFSCLPVMVMVSFSCLPVKVSFNNLPVMVSLPQREKRGPENHIAWRWASEILFENALCGRVSWRCWQPFYPPNHSSGKTCQRWGNLEGGYAVPSITSHLELPWKV